jgi:hypothetical protein
VGELGRLGDVLREARDAPEHVHRGEDAAVGHPARENDVAVEDLVKMENLFLVWKDRELKIYLM